MNGLAAIIIAVGAIVSAPLVIIVQSHATRRNKEQEWARQDRREKEERERQERTARLLLDANKQVEAKAELTLGKLDVIHTLVNSNMSAAMQSEYDAMAAHRVVMLEMMQLRRSQGTEPTEEALEALATIETKLAELDAVLRDRRLQTKLADAQADDGTEMIVRGRPVDEGGA